MPDKFANMPKTVRHFWVVAFSPSAAPEERAKALKGIDGYLREIGADGYDVIRELRQNPSATKICSECATSLSSAIAPNSSATRQLS